MFQMTGFFRSITLTGLVGTMIVALSGGAFAETLRLAHHHAVGGTVDQGANRFAELVDEKSGGAITIEVYPAAQLGQEHEAFQLVDQGAIDMSMTTLGTMDQYYPPMAVTSLPFIFTSWEEADEHFNGEFGEMLADGMIENANTRLLGYFYLGFRDMLFRGDPVTRASGMSGLKMRVPESMVWIRMFELLNARPTPVTWGEVYTAMQTGVADGLEAPAANVIDMRFNEVVNSMVRTRHMFTAGAYAVNEARFDSLSPEHQAILSEAAVEAARYMNFEVAKPAEDSAYGKLEELGMTVVDAEDIGAWTTAMAPLWDEVAATRPGSDPYLEILRSSQ